MVTRMDWHAHRANTNATSEQRSWSSTRQARYLSVTGFCFTLASRQSEMIRKNSVNWATKTGKTWDKYLPDLELHFCSIHIECLPHKVDSCKPEETTFKSNPVVEEWKMHAPPSELALVQECANSKAKSKTTQHITTQSNLPSRGENQMFNCVFHECSCYLPMVHM